MRLLWQNTTRHPLSRFKTIALAYVSDVTKRFQLTHQDVSIIIVSKRRIQQMNHHYRQINQPTDVLTFPGDELYLGDIVICYDVAVKKANELNQTVEDYMRFCVVHGLLHAIGYDHQTNESYDEMMDLQEQVIQRRTP